MELSEIIVILAVFSVLGLIFIITESRRKRKERRREEGRKRIQAKAEDFGALPQPSNLSRIERAQLQKLQEALRELYLSRGWKTLMLNDCLDLMDEEGPLADSIKEAKERAYTLLIREEYFREAKSFAKKYGLP